MTKCTLQIFVCIRHTLHVCETNVFEFFLYFFTDQRKDPEVYKLEDSSCLATDFTDHSAFNSSYPTVRYTGKEYQNYYSTFDFENVVDCKEKSRNYHIQ